MDEQVKVDIKIVRGALKNYRHVSSGGKWGGLYFNHQEAGEALLALERLEGVLSSRVDARQLEMEIGG